MPRLKISSGFFSLGSGVELIQKSLSKFTQILSCHSLNVTVLSTPKNERKVIRALAKLGDNYKHTYGNWAKYLDSFNLNVSLTICSCV